MKNMLKKEFLLAMHPTVPIFLAFPIMFIIPNYSYYVVFFYSCLAIFFTCLGGRENNDIFYTLILPVSKKDVVRARFSFVILFQAAQIIVAVPFAFIRQNMPVPGNEAGMNANISLFGFSLIMLGIFNFIFFILYYKNINKVGMAFLWSGIGVFAYIAIAETCVHVIPFVRDYLNTKDPQYILYKLIVLGIGIVAYCLFTFIAYLKSVKFFDVFDL
jgi:hypothetical protein